MYNKINCIETLKKLNLKKQFENYFISLLNENEDNNKKVIGAVIYLKAQNKRLYCNY